MKVLLKWELEHPTDIAKRKERYKYGREKWEPYWQKKEEEGLVFKRDGWSDGTRHMVSLWEFESAADFAKLWDDEEFHKICSEYTYLVENVKLRILRPGIQLEPED